MEKKKVYLEYLRILACMLVIFNHLPGYFLFSISSGVKQYVYMTLTMITRINVPIFFMISGSLLLKKEENYATVLKKRVSRICFAIILFGGGIHWINFIQSVNEGNPLQKPIQSFVLALFSGDLSGAFALWYLYAYLSFLLVLPFLQRIAQKMKKGDFIILVYMFLNN